MIEEIVLSPLNENDIAQITLSLFSDHCTNFFESNSSEKFIDHQQFEERKEWLENNLKLDGMNIQKN